MLIQRIILLLCLTITSSTGDEDTEGLLVLFQGEVLNGNTAKVIEGEQMNLTCLEKSNNKSDDTVWDGRDLPASFKDIKDQHQFTIPKVDRSYSDDYRCTFKLPGIKYAAYPPRIITVEVLYPPGELTIDGPSEATKNTLVSLNCSADSNPRAVFVWKDSPALSGSSISDGPTLTVNVTEETTIYCFARNTMHPTYGNAVEMIARAKHVIQIRGGYGKLYKTENFPSKNDSSSNSGPVVAAVIGWVLAVVVLIALGIILYLLYFRTKINGTGGYKRGRRNVHNTRGSVTTSSDDYNSHEKPKSLTPKAPERPAHTLSPKTQPLPAYIELKSPEKDESVRITSEELYEDLEDRTTEERYDDIDESEMVKKRKTMSPDGYEEPIESSKQMNSAAVKYL